MIGKFGIVKSYSYLCIVKLKQRIMKKETLERYIHKAIDNIAVLMGKLQDDFTYSYEWGIASQLYRENHQLKIMKRMLQQWSETDETDEVFLKRFKVELIADLINISPLGNSTSDDSNHAKRLRIEATQKLINHYGILADV